MLGGGFHRYCVDAGWEVPHFEKMLYDNALLVRLYAEAAVALPSPEFAGVARELASWLSRELTDPGGGLFSSQDADSEGEEGRFFVFRREELDRLLGAELSALGAAHLGVTPEGNFEHGATVLSLARTAAELAAETGEPVATLEARLAEVRARLFAAREQRIRPATDDKVIAAWNGLAIGGLAAAGRLLGEPSMIEQARRAADFVLDTLRRDGRLLRVHRGGVVQQPGFLDDHAALCEGLVELFESTGERAYLDAARQLAGTIVARFWDDATASFRLSPHDGERLLAPQASVHDNAVPAGASSAVTAFLRLHALVGDERLFTLARTCLSARREAMLQNPFAFGHLLSAAFLAVRGLTEVAVLGAAGPTRDALLAAARSGFAPDRIAFAAASSPSPWLTDRPTPERPTAYVCRVSACEAPVEEPSRLRELLSQAPHVAPA